MTEKRTTLSRRGFIRLGLYNTAGLWVGSMAALGAPDREIRTPVRGEDLERFDWGFIVDTTRCIGCGSCVRACKIENEVPPSYYRTWVERYEIDREEQIHVDSPQGALESFKADRMGPGQVVKAFFVPKLCNHCRNSACTQVCPVGASYHSPDGVVLIDKQRCMGCGYCVQACPYACRYVDHSVGVADKCTFCYHRIHRAHAPACVEACPRQARLYGDLKDPQSDIRKVLHERRYALLKPEMGTNPKCYYLGLDLEVK